MGDFKDSVTAAAINLADDAPWKKIQKNTFTRWCNEHLRSVELQISDLKFDLSDGLVLISLLEVLSHKRMFRKYHTRPTFRQLKLDNVSVALEFLDHEKVKLVSIDSKAIVDGNLKLILGLVWTLIQHYSISTLAWEDEANDSVSKLTPEIRLLGWIQNKVPELPITNFSQDWQDGKALGALVDGLAPGLCPDWESWDAVHRVSNTKEAMQQADDWLGVPQLIAPEEILDPAVDEQSVMTYLSLFPKARLKPGAPLKPKKVPKPKACRATGRGLQSKGMRVGQLADFKVDTCKAGPGNLEVLIRDPSGKAVSVRQKDALEGVYTFEYTPTAKGDHTVDITWVGQHIAKSPFEVHVGSEAGPQKIRAWGPGLEGGTVGLSADFLVESVGVDSGMLGFAIEGPSQAKITCDDQNDGSCLVRFWPTEAGEYAVHVMCDDEEIQDSPFMVSIRHKRKDFHPEKVKVEGPGVSQTGCVVNLQTQFTVDTRQAGEGELRVYAQRADGECVDVSVASEQSGVFVCSYIPSSLSKHTIAVSWGGVMVPGSPFIVTPHRIKIIPCSPVWFKPDGSEMYFSDEEMDLDEDFPDNVRPCGHGELVMNVISPSNNPGDATKVRARGPGLKEGVLGEQAEFIIDTSSAGSGRLAIRVEGPCEVTLKYLDNQDGTCTVFYLPTEHGMYKINVLFDNSHITGSPFQADIQKPIDPSKVLVTGPGLLQGKVGEPCIVNIDCAMAGSGDLSLQAVSDSGVIVQTEVKENEDGTYTAVYVPLTGGVYTLLLKYGGKVVPNFPAKVIVGPKVYKSHVKVSRQGGIVVGERETDTCQVVANGLGLRKGLTGRPNMFSVNARSSVDDLGITVEGASECQVTCEDNGEGMYDVEYTPSVPGEYKITITSGEKSIPEIKYNGDGIYTMSPTPSMEVGESLIDHQSPYKSSRELPSAHAVNMAEIVPGFKGRICGRTSQIFTIGCNSSGEAPETVAVVRPDGSMEFLELKKREDGTSSVVYLPTMDGCHLLTVKFTSEETFNSPFKFRVLPMPDSEYQHHGGQGLRNGTPVFGLDLDAQVCVNTLQTFTIDGSSTGEPPETVAVVTPDGRRDEDVLNKEEPSSQEGRVNDMAPQTSANCYSVAPETVPMVKANDVIGNRDRTCKVACAPNLNNSVMHKYTSDETFRSLSEFQTDLTVENTGPKICAQIPQSFKINSSKSGKPPECALMITPSGKTELTEVKENPDGTYSVKYSPTIDGLHSLMVKYADDDSYCNPLRFHVLPHSASDDEHGINTTEVCSRQLKEDVCAQIPQTFTACCNTDEAPEIDMLKADGTRDLVEVLNNENRAYAATHTPSAEDSHSSAAGNPSEEDFQRHQSSSLHASRGHIGFQNKVEGRNVIPLGAINQAGFISCDIVLPSDISEGEITGEVITPSRKTAQPDVIDNKDGTIIIKFDPSEEGLHQLLIKSTGNDLPVLPLQYYANSCANRSTMAYGCGLMYGIANETATFTICQEDSASSDLDITIEGPSEADVRCLDNADGTCTVSYLPTEPGDYEIQVQHNEMPIRDGNVRRSQVKLGSAVDFTINITEEDISQLSASIMSPTGNDVPCLLKTQPDSHLGVSFIPREAGEHLVSIMKDCEHVSNSPISLSISQAEIGDSSKVKAFGPGLHTGHTFCMSEFVVDTWDAGYGGLTVAIEGPSKVDVHSEEMEQGTCNISYHPIKAGPYKISIKFSDEHIPGSPFTAVVTDRGLMRENIMYNQKASPIASIGSECSLAFKIPGTDTETLSAHVHEPSGTLGEAVIVATGSDSYAVSFLAKEMGVYNVTINNQGQTIPGCPLQYTVGPFGQGGCEKIQVWGQGLQTALASVPADFNIWSREAGAGTLSVSVEGPGKINLHFDDQLDDYYNVSYTAQVPGDYEVSVMFNEEHISESPFLVSVSAVTDKSLTQGQRGDDHNQMCNSYEEPSLSEMEINISSDSSAEPVFLSNASKVICHGPGLSKGILGRKNTFYVDCSKAGRNLLFVGMHGPTVPCERVSIIHMGRHQYRINYAVKERGKYILAVKWGDEHIPGSPFHISVL
ncbi:hypothetical protein PO909_013870 [Leuciscus waleckii]